MITVEIKNLDKLQQALKDYPETAGKILSRAINGALVAINLNANDSNLQFKSPRSLRTGQLSLSFGLGLVNSTPNNLVGRIGPTVNYAKYVEQGTAPHQINVVNKKALANRRQGLIFGRSVNHPGTQANPFMERIIERSKDQINSLFEQAGNQIAAEIANKSK